MIGGRVPHQASPGVGSAPGGADAVVFIVDDDISVREGLEGLLLSEGWRTLSFISAEAFLNHAPVDGPRCLILDVRLPDLNGLELQHRLAADGVVMPIIFITGHGDIPMTVRAMKAGAVEFLTKPFSGDFLLRAVNQAIHASEAALQDGARLEAVRRSYSALSRREREVMEGVVAGRLNKTVAGDLGISEITVKAHRGQVMRKMSARSFAELVNMNALLMASGPGGG